MCQVFIVKHFVKCFVNVLNYMFVHNVNDCMDASQGNKAVHISLTARHSRKNISTLASLTDPTDSGSALQEEEKRHPALILVLMKDPDHMCPKAVHLDPQPDVKVGLLGGTCLMSLALIIHVCEHMFCGLNN